MGTLRCRGAMNLIDRSCRAHIARSGGGFYIFTDERPSPDQSYYYTVHSRARVSICNFDSLLTCAIFISVQT